MIQKSDRINIRSIILIPITILGPMFFNIGPGLFTLRNIGVFILILYLLLRFKNVVFNSVAKWYCIYLCVHLIANMFNGEIFLGQFWRTIFPYHFVSLIILLGMPLLLKSSARIKYALLIIYVFFIVNAVVTALQYTNSDIGWSISYFMNPVFTSEVEESLSSSYQTTLGMAICSGFLSTSFLNGYFVSVYLPLVTTQIYGDNVIRKLFACVMLIVGAITIFMIQQRMATVVLGVYLMFLVLKKSFSKAVFIFIVLGSLFYLIGKDNINFADEKYGRSFAFFENNDTRMSMLQDMSDFVDGDDILFGGFERYKANNNDLRQHNTFLDVITKDGIFGLPFFICFFFVVASYCIKTIRTNHNPYSTQCAVGVLLYLLYSQTHSSGIQSGISFFWFLIALIISIENLKTERLLKK